MQHDLAIIDEWLNFHYLISNYSKTKYILFTGKRKFESSTEPSLDISIGSKVIERVEYIKIVGLLIDESLSFSCQTDQLKNKIIPFVSKFASIRRFISQKTALMLYHAHVYSHMIFMNSIWSIAPKYLTESIGVIQRRALRYVYRKSRYCSNAELFNSKILPLSLVCEYNQYLIVFKIIRNKIKNHIPLSLLSDMHNQNTRARARDDLNVNYSLYDKDFYFRATRAYNNNLPDNIKKITSINVFKSKVKEYLYANHYKR